MNEIIEKDFLSENVGRLVIHAPLIAEKRRAGHFVIVKIGEKGERIPLTISTADPSEVPLLLLYRKWV
jgi:glutamate synthase (NADPH) small chain